VTGHPRIVVLRKRAEFLAVAAQGRKWATPGLILQKGVPAQPEKSIIRYGLTTSGKVGNAVIRNRARRRLRALALDILPRHAIPGYDYVLIGRDTTPVRDFKALEQDLLTALRKLGAYRDQDR
jgi:ribonuclease P protein component